MSNLAAQLDAGPVRWVAVADTAELQRAACRRILDAAARAIKRRGEFICVLSGGETPRGVYQMLRAASGDWSRWHVYFGDERCLPADDAERNSKMAAEACSNTCRYPSSNYTRFPPSAAPMQPRARMQKRCARLESSIWCCLGLAKTVTPRVCFRVAVGVASRMHRTCLRCSTPPSRRASACRSSVRRDCFGARALQQPGARERRGQSLWPYHHRLALLPSRLDPGRA